MEFKSLTDKLYHIVTSGELLNMHFGDCLYILNEIFAQMNDEEDYIVLFENGWDCKDVLSSLRNDTVESAESRGIKTINNDTVPLDECIELDKPCILKIETYVENGALHVNPSGISFDNEIEMLQHVNDIMNEKLIDNNIDIRKILKQSLHDRTLKRFVAKYDI